jgi:hypothetical protein
MKVTIPIETDPVVSLLYGDPCGCHLLESDGKIVDRLPTGKTGAGLA